MQQWQHALLTHQRALYQLLHLAAASVLVDVPPLLGRRPAEELRVVRASELGAASTRGSTQALHCTAEPAAARNSRDCVEKCVTRRYDRRGARTVRAVFTLSLPSHPTHHADAFTCAATYSQALLLAASLRLS